jgi:hypothetical protein
LKSNGRLVLFEFTPTRMNKSQVSTLIQPLACIYGSALLGSLIAVTYSNNANRKLSSYTNGLIIPLIRADDRNRL